MLVRSLLSSSCHHKFLVWPGVFRAIVSLKGILSAIKLKVFFLLHKNFHEDLHPSVRSLTLPPCKTQKQNCGLSLTYNSWEPFEKGTPVCIFKTKLFCTNSRLTWLQSPVFEWNCVQNEPFVWSCSRKKKKEEKETALICFSSAIFHCSDSELVVRSTDTILLESLHLSVWVACAKTIAGNLFT